MKKFFKVFLSIGLSITLLFASASVAFASNILSTNQDLAVHKDLFMENVTENVEINGVSYLYSLSYVGENRVVTIKNVSTGLIDIVVYDLNSGKIFCNNEVIAFIQPIKNVSGITTFASGWESLGKSSHRVTWAQGTTVAVVAAAMAVVLPVAGPAGIIAAMGTAVLSTIAASSVGGTIEVEIQMLNNWPQPILYRYIWTFTASTGDKYGPYITMG